MSQPNPGFLSSAVDLSTLARSAPAPRQAGGRGGMPDEFSVSIVGDQLGRPHVMLGFGHLRWMFEPALAADLATVLADAATQASAMPAQMGHAAAEGTDAPTNVEGSP